MARDQHTDGSPEQVGLATEYLWRQAAFLRWHDSDVAYRLAEDDLAKCVNADGVVSAGQVRRVAVNLARTKRFLINNAPLPVARPAQGSSGSSTIGVRPRSVLARRFPRVDADAPEHQPRPRRDTGGGRIPSGYRSPS